jgi:hypothetical protein
MKNLSTKMELLYDAGTSEIMSFFCSDDLAHWFAVIRNTLYRFSVVADGVQGPEYEHMGSPVLLPDGARVFYRARRAGRDYVVIGGQKTQEHEVPGNAFRVLGGVGPVASETRCWMGEWFGRRVDFSDFDYEDRMIHCRPKKDPWFSPDLSRFACALLRGPRAFVVIDGEPGPEYECVGEVIFSADSKHFAYAAVNGEDAFVVFDGKEMPSPGPVAELRLSPNGQHIAWISADIEYKEIEPSDEFVLIDGVVGPSFDRIEGLRFSEDGREILYIGRLKQRLFRVSVELE